MVKPGADVYLDRGELAGGPLYGSIDHNESIRFETKWGKVQWVFLGMCTFFGTLLVVLGGLLVVKGHPTRDVPPGLIAVTFLFGALMFVPVSGVLQPYMLELAKDQWGWQLKLHCRARRPYIQPLSEFTGIIEIGWADVLFSMGPTNNLPGPITAGVLQSSPGWCIYFHDPIFDGWMVSLQDHEGFLAKLTEICVETKHNMHPILLDMMKGTKSDEDEEDVAKAPDAGDSISDA
eukprot:TRINITY_DN12052_c0_g1_i3.p1 TRINITY_DN12052_c0_g1~~TRINITY_DN12052_c0_g1_i3.p1  ORF type:complete len:234 (-),score=31.69 TRINITY_DN12052_c0_g1_i3:215-916(-)